jgi:hypothetical protein
MGTSAMGRPSASAIRLSTRARWQRPAWLTLTVVGRLPREELSRLLRESEL